MTREEERLEQAKFYIDKGVKDSHRHFLRGAEWADSTMIDKACEWLEENYIPPAFGDMSESKEFIAKFRKAMKGE